VGAVKGGVESVVGVRGGVVPEEGGQEGFADAEDVEIARVVARGKLG
jgi:hypothetical protein